MFKRIFQYARTPLERIGLVIVLVSAVTWCISAIHWNLTRHAFIYPHQYSWTEKVNKPEDSPTGTYWRNGRYGWELMNKECVNKNRPPPSVSVDIFGNFVESPVLGYVPPKECQLRLVPHKQKVRSEWKESFSNFINESFNSEGGDYYYINMPATLTFVFGAFLLFGWAGKLLSWIRYGTKD